MWQAIKRLILKPKSAPRTCYDDMRDKDPELAKKLGSLPIGTALMEWYTVYPEDCPKHWEADLKRHKAGKILLQSFPSCNP